MLRTECIKALAFDRKNSNRRPAFSMQQSMVLDESGCWLSERVWTGVGEQVIAREKTSWRNGLEHVAAEIESLKELSYAACQKGSSGGELLTGLKSKLTDGQERRRILKLPCEAVTLSSFPFLIAKHWRELPW